MTFVGLGFCRLSKLLLLFLQCTLLTCTLLLFGQWNWLSISKKPSHREWCLLKVLTTNILQKNGMAGNPFEEELMYLPVNGLWGTKKSLSDVFFFISSCCDWHDSGKEYKCTYEYYCGKKIQKKIIHIGIFFMTKCISRFKIGYLHTSSF